MRFSTSLGDSPRRDREDVHLVRRQIGKRIDGQVGERPRARGDEHTHADDQEDPEAQRGSDEAFNHGCDRP